jgi:hypothetical protein
MTWLQYLEQRFGPRWALCRNTQANRERYGKCLTRKQFDEVIRDYCQTFGTHPYAR